MKDSVPNSAQREPLRAARLRPADVVRLGGTGLRTRPLRVFLSALGIAIGVAAMIAVVGISGSGQAEVDRRLDALGTNLLRVAPGESLAGEKAELPYEAVSMIRRIPPVRQVAATGATDAHVYRNERIAIGRTGSLTVLAAGRELLPAVGGQVRRGRWLDSATDEYPAVVLGATAAQRLDVYTPGTRLWLGGRWFSLIGVLDPVPLAPELDSAALVGWSAARTYLGFEGHPSTVYVRAQDSEVAAVRAVLPATAHPENPGEVRISRPSDALAAREATESALTGLLLGLGGVALLVGGVGVGNTMVISVLERRGEIGLRRALGATRGQIRTQFVTESLLLSLIGGLAGTVLGTLITAGYALSRDWPTVVPAWASVAGVAATLLIGMIAGLYPAVRASRLAPTEALAGT
ncbi:MULTISPECIES: ABC transporter permease [unclassified Streptomyces]|uniref:ABC transporter permease n=1 Tax=unclassified Streptomyces TaxID=2593676 RepID=UPI002250E080|nr:MULTISPECIES: ABC transporter permease [unclassified Streptomyces]MCX5332606.1 ABC transporter permease [Streptomyces sp. NBC_00140]MCX5362004.1 ABC transporter permease [Streptomyces sp. NBC_00124]